MSVTFLLPGFSIFWGTLFLHEPLTSNLLVGCAIVLLGTSLANGVLTLPGLAKAAAPAKASL